MTSLYDFTATAPEQLTIQQDDRLRIVEGSFVCCIPNMQLLTRCVPVLVETAVEGWYLVEDESGAEGLVPNNYLELSPPTLLNIHAFLFRAHTRL